MNWLDNLEACVHANSMMEAALSIEDHDAATYHLNQFLYFYAQLKWAKTKITFKSL